MDTNTLERKLRKEHYEIIQNPNGQIKPKIPGPLVENRWRYRDNPWNGIGEKEYTTKLKLWDNTTPWEHGDSIY